ncbi:methyltransferase domain-containing protein [Saccharopolyspora sp. TS4A08]|uniref:Methyltransferase domain-containing protein n=1 Tax=Saccharopolyspora ipomoeae TaxID=3042027 RepID=A0ABT6PIY5_9PSEU|nr:methyltransferase domain-containing protein [Saccharopolyspora sp. TS4A08]MDI2027914.1 methyltransferase domain-containing protein [Saccharopolyspora sp. TS4A08]
MTSLAALIRADTYPRSATYDPQWMVDNCMGPNPLWLLEDLVRDCPLEPGMKVLDLGCGPGMTSIFLAREYDVEVWASELWVPPEDNAARFDRADVADRVHAVRAEAHDLPFDPEQFDAILSVGTYHYFGTDDLYVGYISKFLKPGGWLSIAVPSLHRELRELGGVPAHLRSGAGWEVLPFHTPEWWRFQWEQTGLIEVTASRAQPEGWLDWKLWCEVCAEHSPDELVRSGSRATIPMLDADRGQLLTFAQVTGRRTQAPSSGRQ